MKSVPKKSWVLGIDGGGTHTRGYLADLNGRVLRTAQTGPLNWNTSGWPQARATLQKLLLQLHLSPAQKRHLTHTVIGCAALNDPATEQELHKLTHRLLPTAHTSLISDGESAWFGAGLGRAGVLVISGTGSVVFAGPQLSHLIHIGGWGPLLGDEGSARWMATQLLRRCLGAHEGTLPPVTAKLERRVLRYWNIRNWSRIFDALYSNPSTTVHLGELAAHIDQHLPKDPHWLKIGREAGKSLASQAFAASLRAELFQDQNSPVPCWVQGGVLCHNSTVQRTFRNALRGTQLQFSRPQLHPSLGSLALAFHHAGVPLAHHPKILSTLRQSFARHRPPHPH